MPTIKYCVLFSLLLLTACAQHAHSPSDARWSGYVAQQNEAISAGHYEYNGIGGSGRRETMPADNGLGGSGKDLLPRQANGLGGSGRTAPHPLENGLGGSGRQGDKAAIFGAISKFGSIWVNDRHIELPDTTQYFLAGQPARSRQLRLGQTVAVLADAISEDEYQAIEVHMIYNAIGKVDSISLVDGQRVLQVLGQNVRITENTRIQNQAGDLISEVSQHQRVAISGIRAPDQSIQASLIVINSPQATLLAGPVDTSHKQWQLGGQPLKFTAGAPDLSQPLQMRGEMLDGFFVVSEWQVMPHDRILSIADEIWLEGFPVNEAELFIEGFEVQLPEISDDLFEFEDSMRIGIDLEEQEYWLEHEPPEFDHYDEYWDGDEMLHRGMPDQEEYDEQEYDDYHHQPPEHEYPDHYDHHEPPEYDYYDDGWQPEPDYFEREPYP